MIPDKFLIKYHFIHFNKLIEEMIYDISLPIVDVAFLLSKADLNEFSEMKVIKTQKSSLLKPEPIGNLERIYTFLF